MTSFFTDFHIVPIIVMTLLLGIIQLIFVHKDEPFRGSHAFSHGLHIVILMPIFLFAVFNITTVANLIGLPTGAWYLNEYLVRGVVAFVFGIKSYAMSAVSKGAAGRGMHEGILHVLIMMLLVFAAPFVWPILEPMMPAWAR